MEHPQAENGSSSFWKIIGNSMKHWENGAFWNMLELIYPLVN